jgi:hypothetical protein
MLKQEPRPTLSPVKITKQCARKFGDAETIAMLLNDATRTLSDYAGRAHRDDRSVVAACALQYAKELDGGVPHVVTWLLDAIALDLSDSQLGSHAADILRSASTAASESINAAGCWMTKYVGSHGRGRHEAILQHTAGIGALVRHAQRRTLM